MTHFSRYVWVSLLTIGAGQVSYALPRVESRAIPTQTSASVPSSTSLSEEVLEQISALQREVQELRGLMETQEHELKRVEKSQQTLFLNLEQQLVEKNPKIKPIASAPAEVSPVIKKEEVHEKVSHSDTEISLIKAAEDFLKQKKYAEAEKNYQSYLADHPTGQYAPGVYYTLGEIYWTEWHTEKSNTLLLEKAIHAFSDVANGFPHHTKAKDALLKIGLVEIEKGNYQTAAQYFKRVIDKYPQSPSAKIAELRLQKLTQDGRIS